MRSFLRRVRESGRRLIAIILMFTGIGFLAMLTATKADDRNPVWLPPTQEGD